MFVIRGVGTFAFNDALEQSVGLVVDGVPMARLVGSISDAVDLGQVQLLRGPQGTIFGKNATAGLIAIDYREPTFTRAFEGRVFMARTRSAASREPSICRSSTTSWPSAPAPGTSPAPATSMRRCNPRARSAGSTTRAAG